MAHQRYNEEEREHTGKDAAKYLAHTLRGLGTLKILPVTEKRIPEGFVTIVKPQHNHRQ